jgi:hypothetical protein
MQLADTVSRHDIIRLAVAVVSIPAAFLGDGCVP